MIEFEKIEISKQENEDCFKIEKHRSIELSDQEYLERLRVLSPVKPEHIKEIIDIVVSPPSIEMKLDMPILQKQIKEKEMDAKPKSKKGKKNVKS